MPDRQAYNASTIDWSRLRAYAQRVARETRVPAESGISYTTTEYQTVTKEVEVKHGFFNLFTRMEPKSETVAVSKRIDVVGRHWVLERRHHHIETNRKERTYSNQETIHEQHYVVLLSDGSLKKAVLTETENTTTADGRTRFFATHEHSLSDLSTRDVEAMDFEKRYCEYGTHGKGTKTWGDRDPGKRLLTQAKGIGLSKALNRLLPR
ncbi:hypothetical protein ACWEIJ_45920 [Lentzea sp. NPDC004789]